jgi:hypothetical protein
MKRIWEWAFATFFPNACLRITTYAYSTSNRLTEGDKVLMAIDRAIRPEWWQEAEEYLESES